MGFALLCETAFFNALFGFPDDRTALPAAWDRSSPSWAWTLFAFPPFRASFGISISEGTSGKTGNVRKAGKSAGKSKTAGCRLRFML